MLTARVTFCHCTQMYCLTLPGYTLTIFETLKYGSGENPWRERTGAFCLLIWPAHGNWKANLTHWARRGREGTVFTSSSVRKYWLPCTLTKTRSFGNLTRCGCIIQDFIMHIHKQGKSRLHKHFWCCIFWFLSVWLWNFPIVDLCSIWLHIRVL